MKPSGVEWLGDVPEHWAVKKIKRVASIRYGIGEPPRYHIEGTPLIRATNIHAGNLFQEGMVFVNPSEIPEQRIVWLDSGDIIVVRSGAYTGDSAIIPEGFGPCILALPPAQEQDEITAFLKAKSSKFDTLTSEAQRAIDLLQERRTALISAAVTGQIDVRGVTSSTEAK